MLPLGLLILSEHVVLLLVPIFGTNVSLGRGCHCRLTVILYFGHVSSFVAVPFLATEDHRVPIVQLDKYRRVVMGEEEP